MTGMQSRLRDMEFDSPTQPAIAMEGVNLEQQSDSVPAE